MSVHRTASAGYTAGGADYQQSRPTYPPEAVDLLAAELGIGPGSRLLDLGAGTGKLSELMQPTGADVVAVEPVTAMLGRLAVPAVHRVAAAAEAIPVADGSVDAVMAGTSFHWFRGDRAVPEIARVLRAGGGLGLVWNNPERDTGWVGQVWSVVDEYRGDAPRNQDLSWREPLDTLGLFTPLEHRRFTHHQHVSPEGLLSRVASISFIAALPGPEHRRALDRVQRIITTHPDVRDRTRLPLPYRTDTYWCRLRIDGAAP